ncbi:MAG: exonuclease SbcCD subunit D [Bacteroidales bacterium]|nr:exonuclease SbcCD subunit D [Bacteroidales bacterium]
MKILHTSDWHLGHTLYNYDRTEEQMAMLEQITSIVAEEKPEVFLLCGDVYHNAQPSAAAQTMFTEALVNIHNANPSMTMVITAGNHDSATRHEIFRTPWKALKVHTIGTLNKDNLDEHIIEIPGVGFVAAVPYAYERNIPDGFFPQLLDAVAERNTAGLPVVMTAHTTVMGCDTTGHDFVAGGIEGIDVKSLGEGYDYLALGHIHHEQFVHTGKHNVRYSGTPIAVSFDEAYAHSVSIVEIDAHNATPVVRKIDIDNPRPLVTLPTTGFASLDEVKELVKDFPADSRAYLRLNVEIDDFLPADARAEIEVLVKDKSCRFCIINAKRKAKENDKSAETTLTVEELKSESPIDIASRYAKATGVTFGDDLKQLFEQVLQAIEEEERNN